MPAATDCFECFWKYKKIPTNVKRAWSGCIMSVWFIFRPRQMGSRLSTTDLSLHQNPPSSISSQWATASSSSFCLFWWFFSVPICAEIISCLCDITAHHIASFKSDKQSNAMKCMDQQFMFATRKVRTFPGGTDISAWVSLKIEQTLPWLRTQPMRSVASSAVCAASSFSVKYLARMSWN